MIEELFHIGPVSVSPFGVMMMLSFVASFFSLRSYFLASGQATEEDASAVVFAAGFGGLLGAKIYYALLYSDWSLLWQRWGFVWYGGFLLGAAFVLLTLWRRKLPIWMLFDGAAVSLALGYAVGRVGCFLVGDDYGVPTDLPWAVAFPVGLPPSRAGWLRTEFGVEIPAEIPDQELLAVHPTQIYETLACLVIFWIGRRMLKSSSTAGKNPRIEGMVGLIVISMLAVERFLVEFLRAKDDRLFGDFTMAQIISVCVVLAALGVAYWRRTMVQWQRARDEV